MDASTIRKILAVNLLIGLLSPLTSLASVFSSDTTYSVCFTPGGDCTNQIVERIDHAQESIYVQAYSFTSLPIIQAIINANKRGIEVAVILDKSQYNRRQTSSAKVLVQAGVPTWIDYKPAIAHNKVMVIDHGTVITGSFNYTAAAQNHNAENVMIINDKNLANTYLQNWQKRERVSNHLNSVGFN